MGLSREDREHLWSALKEGRSPRSMHRLFVEICDSRGLDAEQVQRERAMLTARYHDELDPIERKHRAWFSVKYCVICGGHSTAISAAGIRGVQPTRALAC